MLTFLVLLKHNEAIINLYIHEIAMHHSHNIDDFRPPYGVEDENDEEVDYITPAHIDSLTTCLASIHKAFDAFLEMPNSMLQALPTLFYVRNSYAAVALIKMFTAVSAKGSKFGSVFKPQELKVEYYLDAVGDKMKRAAEGGQSRIAMKFTYILSMLKSWQAKRMAGPVSAKDRCMLVKSMGLGWEKVVTADGKKAARISTPASDSGNSNANAKAKSQHSGLHMLSEVAMGNKNASSSSSSPPTITNAASSDPDATAAAGTTTTQQSQWESQLSAYPDMQHQQQQQPQALPQQQATSSSNNTNMPPSQAIDVTFPQQAQAQSQPQPQQPPYMSEVDSLAFTAEELSALGTMMDDPGWLSFGLESGGWGFVG
jgi:hypothetical protein